jgi:hypothetical protein
MRKILVILAIALAAATLAQAAPAAEETRADSLGWQYEDFADNVNLTFAPAAPTPMEPVVIRAQSRNPLVHIQVAYAYMTVQLVNSGPVTTGLTFSRYNETVMTCTLSAYPNGTLVRFYVNVLDYYNTPAISGNCSYTVMGQDRPGGWIHSEFSKNLNVTCAPNPPNASQPAKVTITSKDSVLIYGAYLYVTYETVVGQPQSGGFPFNRVNQTSMYCDIPGYPMGTAVRFWVSAWDKYNNLTISGYYNYTVPREEDYTSHDFVEFDGLGAVGGLAAFAAVGSWAFLRVLGSERERREKGTKYGKSGQDGSLTPSDAAAAESGPGKEKGGAPPKKPQAPTKGKGASK